MIQRLSKAGMRVSVGGTIPETSESSLNLNSSNPFLFRLTVAGPFVDCTTLGPPVIFRILTWHHEFKFFMYEADGDQLLLKFSFRFCEWIVWCCLRNLCFGTTHTHTHTHTHTCACWKTHTHTPNYNINVNTSLVATGPDSSVMIEIHVIRKKLDLCSRLRWQKWNTFNAAITLHAFIIKHGRGDSFLNVQL